MYRMLFCAAISVACASTAQSATFNTLNGAAPKVIAHRGASGWLPEHTLGGYELAIKMGADIIEPDLQLTSDGVLVAMHDSTLTRTTNVETLFDKRNGDYNVGDFTLAEIKSLTVEPYGPQADTSHDGFTPSMAAPFKVPTFDEVLDLVNAHNAATGDVIGVYPESKVPNRSELSRKIVETLNAKGFTDREQNTYIQTFSHDGARELAALQDTLNMDNAVAALGAAVEDNGVFGVYDYTTQITTTLTDLATFADGAGVSLSSASLNFDFIEAAHALGLEVHGWTFRPLTQDDANDLFAPYIAMGLDGFFTDYPNFGRAAIDTAMVPLPAGGLLLIAGLGGLAATRRRRG